MRSLNLIKGTFKGMGTIAKLSVGSILFLSVALVPAYFMCVFGDLVLSIFVVIFLHIGWFILGLALHLFSFGLLVNMEQFSDVCELIKDNGDNLGGFLGAFLGLCWIFHCCSIAGLTGQNLKQRLSFLKIPGSPKQQQATAMGGTNNTTPQNKNNTTKPTYTPSTPRPPLTSNQTAPLPAPVVDFESSGYKAKTFDDIAGYQATKDNMMFLVDCMKNAGKLAEVGGKLPKGVLFYGPPGTGKTLMAAAVAGSAGVGFVETNASSFINTYVGTGAAAVRKLYNEARAKAPCIVFIDELDAVGGKRTDSSNQEYRSTINALLSQLDGISAAEGILTIAATNTIDQLDDALIRPGRFDRKVAIPLPSQSDRLAILKLHVRNKRLGEDVSLEALSADTAGMSGASLATLINEAAIGSVTRGDSVIMACDIEKATFNMMVGGEEVAPLTGHLGQLVSYHEAGHALVFKILCKTSVPRVTIYGSTSGALGLTFQSNDIVLETKSGLENQIRTLYAGRLAEELFLGNTNDITSGASHDLKEATKLIERYVDLYGANGSILYDPSSAETKTFMKDTADRLFSETRNFLTINRAHLDRLAEVLYERKSLNESEIDQILCL